MGHTPKEPWLAAIRQRNRGSNARLRGCEGDLQLQLRRGSQGMAMAEAAKFRLPRLATGKHLQSGLLVSCFPNLLQHSKDRKTGKQGWGGLGWVGLQEIYRKTGYLGCFGAISWQHSKGWVTTGLGRVGLGWVTGDTGKQACLKGVLGVDFPVDFPAKTL